MSVLVYTFSLVSVGFLVYTKAGVLFCSLGVYIFVGFNWFFFCIHQDVGVSMGFRSWALESQDRGSGFEKPPGAHGTHETHGTHGVHGTAGAIGPHGPMEPHGPDGDHELHGPHGAHGLHGSQNPLGPHGANASSHCVV